MRREGSPEGEVDMVPMLRLLPLLLVVLLLLLEQETPAVGWQRRGTLCTETGMYNFSVIPS